MIIDDDKCTEMLEKLDKFLEELTGEFHPNYYELIHILYMMDMKIKASNIEQYKRERLEEHSKVFDIKKTNDEDLK